MSWKDIDDKFMKGEVVALPGINTEDEPFCIGIVSLSDYESTYVIDPNDRKNICPRGMYGMYRTDRLVKWNKHWINTMPDNPLVKQVIEDRVKRIARAKHMKGKKSPYRMMEGEEYEDRKTKKATKPKRKVCKCKK